MKQLTKIFLVTLAVTFSTSARALDSIDSIDQSNLQQLKQMACNSSNSNNTQELSFNDLESTLTQTLNAYGIKFTEEQLQTAYNQATETVAQLEVESIVQQFCNDY